MQSPFKNILVPIDFSETSLQALRLAIRLAREGAARLTLLHVGVSPVLATSDPWLATSAEVLLQWHKQLAEEQNHALRRVAREEVPQDIEWRASVEDGFPPETILAAAKSGEHDLIVMGTHGRTGLERILMGSVAERVIRASPVPVLSVR